MNKKMNKERTNMTYKEDLRNAVVDARAYARVNVWDEAIADAERKIEGYKGRIAKLRSAVRILRGLKKKNAAKSEVEA